MADERRTKEKAEQLSLSLEARGSYKGHSIKTRLPIEYYRSTPPIVSDELREKLAAWAEELKAVA